MGKVRSNRRKARKAGQTMKEFKSAQSAKNNPAPSPSPQPAAPTRRERGGTRRAERKAVAQKSFDSQGPIQQASDFNFDTHSQGKVANREIKHLRKSGMSRQSIQEAAANSGVKIGGRAQKRFDNWDARRAAKERVNGTPVAPTPQEPVPEVNNTPTPPPTQTIKPAPGTEITPTPTPSPTPSPSPSDPNQPNPSPSPSPYPSTNIEDSFNNENEQNTDYTQELNINQDNDINTNINGDGNYVNNNQDNSIRNYGGDVRTFNYQSSGGGTDSPVSAATMAGYYAPDDSHAANAARLDRQITQAGDYAKDNMNTDWIAQGAIHKASQNAYIDPAVLDQRVTERSEASKAKAHTMGEGIYGDIFGKMPQWGNLNS